MTTVSDFQREHDIRDRYRQCDADLQPEAKVEHAERNAGVDMVMGNGGWWMFMYSVSRKKDSTADYVWFASVVLDDGQNEKHMGISGARGDASAQARLWIRERMSWWALCRTRVRRAQNYVASTLALQSWRPPAPLAMVKNKT